jgi:hypothetical protein
MPSYENTFLNLASMWDSPCICLHQGSCPLHSRDRLALDSALPVSCSAAVNGHPRSSASFRTFSAGSRKISYLTEKSLSGHLSESLLGVLPPWWTVSAAPFSEHLTWKRSRVKKAKAASDDQRASRLSLRQLCTTSWMPVRCYGLYFLSQYRNIIHAVLLMLKSIATRYSKTHKIPPHLKYIVTTYIIGSFWIQN